MTNFIQTRMMLQNKYLHHLHYIDFGKRGLVRSINLSKIKKQVRGVKVRTPACVIAEPKLSAACSTAFPVEQWIT